MNKKNFLNLAIVAMLLTGCSSESASTSTAESEVNNSTPSATATVNAEEFQEQTIVDNESCTVTLKEIDEDGIWGYSWKLNLVNKTDKTLMYAMNDVSVNGVMADPFWASDVAPGKEANETVTWMSSTLEENGIEADSITQVTFTLSIYDNDDWAADRIVDQEFTIYPKGEEAASIVEDTTSESDVVLIDNDQITMTVKGFDEDALFGFEMKLSITNKTDQNIMVAADNVSIDGIMCDPFWAATITAGKKSNENVTWMTTTLEDAGLSSDTISLIEFPVRIYDNDTYENILEQTFNITITR